jgi:acetyl esterase/lipase
MPQVCLKSRWPLISPSYRLLPQAKGSDLVEDASAAYAFAAKWDVQDGEPKRRVIVAGASGGKS